MESKQTRSFLLRDGCVSNPPWRDGQCHPSDGIPLNLIQSPQEMRINLTLFLNVGDRVFPLPQVTLGRHLTHLAKATQFRKFVATLDSSQIHANRQQQCALT